jgi:hypothetical protein
MCRKRARARASSGVEECIRAVYDLMAEVWSVVGNPDDPLTKSTASDETEAFRRIVMRMSRFTGRYLTPKPK